MFVSALILFRLHVRKFKSHVQFHDKKWIAEEFPSTSCFPGSHEVSLELKSGARPLSIAIETDRERDERGRRPAKKSLVLLQSRLNALT